VLRLRVSLLNLLISKRRRVLVHAAPLYSRPLFESFRDFANEIEDVVVVRNRLRLVVSEAASMAPRVMLSTAALRAVS
jgi:hypothetical protein